MGYFWPLNRNKFNININMSKFLQRILVILTVVMLPMTILADGYQLPDPSFEDWSGSAFDGKIQPKYWHGSNVEQVGFKFNFTFKEAGHTGSASLMVKDMKVGAMGITETGPGYASLGYAWQYLEGLSTGSATAGTIGGISFTHRPDTVAIWIKRTGDNATNENFNIVFYSWKGTATGTSYKSKSGGCTSVTQTDEESDIRIALDGNECKTTKAGSQVAEGWLCDRKYYGEWTQVRVPIYYLNDDVPEKCNLILSAANYPNFRANSGLYEGNALYVDDVELIYSSKIHTLRLDGKEWKGFDPNSTDVQEFNVPEGTTKVPTITGFRGAGSLTNEAGHGNYSRTQKFDGRQLTSSEMSVNYGPVGGITTITVKAEDGSSTTTYKIKFVAAKSSNAKLANITYTYTDINDKVQTASIDNFSPSTYNYTVELPYGVKSIPVVACDTQEYAQKFTITQPTAITGSASIVVTAANGTTKQTYNVSFKVGLLADNTLKDIKVDGKSIPGFNPTQTVYKVSLPVGTTAIPEIVAVSAYAKGEQTIVHKAPSVIDGGTYTISVSTPGNTVAKVYKLNFKLEASSYSYLKDLKVGDYIKNFDPQNTTYYINLPMGTTELPKIEAEKGDEFQTIVISNLAAGVVDGTARVTVTAGNGDQTVYKIVFSTEKSERSTLKGIQIGGVDLEGFDPDKTSYTYALTVGTTELPEIKAIPGDEYQTISITTAGVNGKTRITVTAGNGTTTIYQIAFSVATFTDNTLASLSVEGRKLQAKDSTEVEFDPEIEEYWVYLPQGTTERPVVKYTPAAEKPLQEVYPRDFTGLNGDYKITVRPQSGSSRTYIIHFSVATSDNNSLTMIYLIKDGKKVQIPNFRPDSLHYIDSLPEGVTTIPTVTFDKGDENQKVLSVLEGKTHVITVTAESGEKREYRIDFIVRASANAFLNNILLDGVGLTGFRKDSLGVYKVILKTEKCPAITVDKVAGQQVTITAPYGVGEALILVQPEQGSSNTYRILFEREIPASVKLNGITINTVPFDEFNEDVLTYTSTYEKELPEITWSKKISSQNVQLVWKGDVAYLNVTDAEGNKLTYSIAFTREYSQNTSLEGIYADGVKLTPTAEDYTKYEYELEAGSSYPEITYKTKDNTEVIYFGQVEKGKWAITVLAEDQVTTVTYTVQYTIKKYNDATLKNLALTDKPGAITFVPTIFTYEVGIDQGEALPELIVEAREGQTVNYFNLDDTHQQVIVYAESGATNTYNITYTREISTNALLADILIDGVSLEGFDPNTYSYIDTIARGSKFVPNVFPVGANENQTITTYHGRPDGTTKIHVVAQDPTITQDYFIQFPVKKSNNNKLGDLYLGDEQVFIRFKDTTLNYVVNMPYGRTECPAINYEKADSTQRIDFISRPLGQTSEIIVTAENGETRKYTILFKETLAPEANVLKSITIAETGEQLDLSDAAKTSFDVNVPFGSRSLTVKYEKMYPEQTVFVQPGGVHNPTIITVKPNRPGEEDLKYTITPHMAIADPAVLTDIRVNGSRIEGFNSEKFSYIVKVDNIKNVLRYDVADGARIDVVEQTTKHFQANVTVGERVNTYNVWFYYQNDTIPNPDFSEWVDMEVYKGDPKDGWADIYYDNREPIKPKGWHVVGDALDKDVWMGTMYFYPTELIARINSNQVRLTSVYGDGLGGTIPAFITLGKVGGSYGRFGATTFNIGSGISFHNSPDQMILTYNSSEIYNHNLIQYTLYGQYGDTTLTWSDTETSSSLKTVTFDLSKANEVAGYPTSMNIILCAAHQVSGFNMNHHTTMVIDKIRMTYNHTLDSMLVDSILVKPEGGKMVATLADPERIEKPILKFFGHVEDQSPLVNWSDASVDGDYSVRTATIKNYAENGTDYTDYTLTVKRPLDTRNTLDSICINGKKISGFNASTTEYEVIVRPKAVLPDVQPFASSSLQTITTVYNAETKKMTITVTSEKGETKEYIITFSTPLSDDVTLPTITATGLTPDYDPAVKEYTITSGIWPLITYTKRSDLQKVEMNNGVLTVTAENGATGTYTIVRQDPSPATTGVISKFNYADEQLVEEFGGATTDKEAAKPTKTVLFTRECASDSVVFVQAPDKMQWLVYGTENKTYTWTYPDTPSENDLLADIKLNGESAADFNPSGYEYDWTSDSTLVLSVVAADPGQTITTTQTIVEGGVEYEIVVVSEAGSSHSKTYKVTVKRSQSEIVTLAGIYLDDVLVTGFHPDSLNYTVTLPVPAVKVVQPKMPSITYLVGHPGQKVEVTKGELNGAATELMVWSEKGAKLPYSIIINAQKSACVDLTSIVVNNEPIDQFEPGRHYYSKSLNTNTINVDYTSDDRFQTVTHKIDTVKIDTVVKNIVNEVVVVSQVRYTLHVQAEHGETADYEIMIYIENQSNDAQLANILLDAKDFVDFNRALNEDLTFDPGNNNYVINLFADQAIPEVSATLKMEGQSVDIVKTGDVINLNVRAFDGTLNTYTLTFNRPKSHNAALSMIFLDGDSIKGFDPNNYFYSVNLPVGVHKLPEVAAQKGEYLQTIESVNVDQDKLQATIKVLAEETSYTATYNVVFAFTQSDVDTLAMIYQDGQGLPGFRADSIYYPIGLPVGTTAFPDVSWEVGDDWQTVSMNQLDSTATTLIQQIVVTSESKHTRTYTVAYTIEKSDVDTLQMIFIDHKPLAGFDANTVIYLDTLSAEYAAELAGQLPAVEYTVGDEYQTVQVSQVPEDELSEKSLGYKSLISVTAATGKTRIYTIHYPVELSNDSTLNMINVSGEPLANFDAERFNYRLEIEKEAAVPVVTVIKKEDAQTYDIRVLGDTVQVVVWAESGKYQSTYTLIFERLKSKITTLRDIILTDEAGQQFPSSEFPYRPEVYAYIVNLQYQPNRPLEELLPEIAPVFYDSLQTAEQAFFNLPNGDIQCDITVTAPNGEDQAVYSITFHFVRPNDATLMMIAVNNVEFADFRSTKTEYIYAHPYGTDPSEYFTQDAVTFVLSDSLATDTIYTDDNGNINIVVTAQDGRTSMTYIIIQITAEDGDNTLAWITVDNDTIAGFDPLVTEYTYYIFATDVPSIDAAANSENAQVDFGRFKADSIYSITCTAADGTERIYNIRFAITSVDPGVSPTSKDVLLKRVPGANQLVAFAVRQGVSIALYDRNGHILYENRVPVANPNDTEVVLDAEEDELLNNAELTQRSGLYIDIDLNTIYFYVFFNEKGKKLASGKIMCY